MEVESGKEGGYEALLGIPTKFIRILIGFKGPTEVLGSPRRSLELIGIREEFQRTPEEFKEFAGVPGITREFVGAIGIPWSSRNRPEFQRSWGTPRDGKARSPCNARPSVDDPVRSPRERPAQPNLLPPMQSME